MQEEHEFESNLVNFETLSQNKKRLIQHSWIQCPELGKKKKKKEGGDTLGYVCNRTIRDFYFYLDSLRYRAIPNAKSGKLVFN